MSTRWFIAWRYLFSKKSTNAINLITGISVLGFAVGAFALITILSALNGFESLIGFMIRDFDPQIKIEAEKGKSFELNPKFVADLRTIKGVEHVLGIVEENGVFEFEGKYVIAKLRGLPNNYASLKNIEGIMAAGEFQLMKGSIPSVVAGAGIAIKLGIHPDQLRFCNVFLPAPGSHEVRMNPADALSVERVALAGVYMIQEEIDNSYVLLPVELLRDMLGYGNKVTYAELILGEGVDEKRVKQVLRAKWGADFVIRDRWEQNEAIFKVFQSEKLATYAILAFVLLLSAFNTVGSVSMIIADKSNDIKVLQSLGGASSFIRGIFFRLGLGISVIGGIVGLIAGVVLVWSQKTWGWLKMENSVVDYYPVELRWPDVILVMVTVLVLGVVTSLYPAFKSAANKTLSLSGGRNM